MDKKQKQTFVLSLFPSEIQLPQIFSLISTFINNHYGVNVIEKENISHEFTYQIKPGHTAEIKISYIQSLETKNPICQYSDILLIIADFNNPNLLSSLQLILQYNNDNNYITDDKLVNIIGVFDNTKPKASTIPSLQSELKLYESQINITETLLDDFVVHLEKLLLTIYTNKEKTELIIYPSHAEIAEYVIPEGVVKMHTPVQYSPNLTKISFPSSMKTIDEGMFSLCFKLKNVEFSENYRQITEKVL